MANKKKVTPKSLKVEKDFDELEKVFLKNQVSKIQIEVIERIEEIFNTLDLGDETENHHDVLKFNSWNAEKLIYSRQKLSRYSETLGEFISHHESRSDFAYIWRKGAYASDWLPLKTELANTLGKVTNSEVDSELTKRYLQEQYYSMFHRRRADLLVRKIGSIDRLIRTIDHRLMELARQLRLSHEDGFKGPKY